MALKQKKIIETLKQGGIGVLPTDTLYGLVGDAFNEEAVKKIYTLRKRDPRKPLIVLIAEISDLGLFGIHVNEYTKEILEKVWPGKVSVVLPCQGKKFYYLHRGWETIAFRIPMQKALRELLKETGPLVAPSANIEGDPPAETIAAARKYFGGNIDFYENGGTLLSEPSTLVVFKGKGLHILRKGLGFIPKELLEEGD